MKTRFIATLTLAACLSAIAQNPVDPYLGDWKGTVKFGGTEQEVVAAFIALGSGKYEVKFLSTFDHRGPVLFHIKGNFRQSQFKCTDLLSFDPSRVVNTTSQGIVLDASLWSGRFENGTLTGNVAGRSQGEFKLTPFKRTSPTLGAKPPAGAVVLLDGKNLDAWQPIDRKSSAVKWKLVEGDAMQVNGGDIITREKFSDFKLHLEFRTPYMPTASGQGRGNSGVYPQGRYEVQVLDSYGLEGADNECGGIYTVSRPSVNMCLPPLEWQTYDITFKLARCDASGKKTSNARITVVHNGVTVQDNVELKGVTGGAVNDRECEPEGIKLQDHGNPVQYRNIWLEKLN